MLFHETTHPYLCASLHRNSSRQNVDSVHATPHPTSHNHDPSVLFEDAAGRGRFDTYLAQTTRTRRRPITFRPPGRTSPDLWVHHQTTPVMPVYAELPSVKLAVSLPRWRRCMQEAFLVYVQEPTVLLPNFERSLFLTSSGSHSEDTRIIGYACLQAPHIQKYTDR